MELALRWCWVAKTTQAKGWQRYSSGLARSDPNIGGVSPPPGRVVGLPGTDYSGRAMRRRGVTEPGPDGDSREGDRVRFPVETTQYGLEV